MIDNISQWRVGFAPDAHHIRRMGDPLGTPCAIGPSVTSSLFAGNFLSQHLFGAGIPFRVLSRIARTPARDNPVVCNRSKA